MKILFVSEYYPPKISGGGEINIASLANSLSSHGLDIFVLTSYHPGLNKFETIDGVKIIRTLKTGSNPLDFKENFKRSWYFPKSVKIVTPKIVSKFKPDIIHLTGASLIAAPQLSKLQIPLVATIESYPSLCPKGDRIYHGQEECQTRCSFRKFSDCQKKSSEIGKMKNSIYLKYNPLFKRYIYNHYQKLNSALRYCHLIAVSKYVQELLVRHGLNSEVIPNFVNLNEYSKFKRPKNNKLKILYAGSLTRFKGPQTLLKAIMGIDCRCELYGEGPLKINLHNFISEHKLDAEIFDSIPHSEMPKLYSNYDVVVFPSLWPEPFGRIPIEAMASGTPVIGSNIGAVKEVIGSNGLLFKPNDPEDLHHQLKEIQKKNVSNRLVHKGLVQVKEYSEKIVINKLIRLYEDLLK